MEARINQNSVLIDQLIPDSIIRSQTMRWVVDITIVVVFSLLVALSAQIAFRIPTTTVTITGQTFGVLLTGGVLGSKRGASSLFLYMILGMVGMPVFAPNFSKVLTDTSFHFILPWHGHSSTIWESSGFLTMTSGGYIIGFILAAYVVGRLAEKGWNSKPRITLALLIGNLLIYVIGLPWLGYIISTNSGIYDYIVGSNVLDKTLKGGLYPFIGGDAVKLVLAGLALPGVTTLVRRLKFDDTND